ncbi:family 43 glycosylhydrolase [Sabulilitoribacter arenilitoris]|uniref:Family 43 glycosylhydrolase n=1 Tax=Wocania arenilitoris TaxID=2044858 RepID=A0AAE3EMP8_9FLAO|nr:family 43 glycosylhydrolase [Wocania arenilitoris]MCF7568231.1 family 43 glycosylhydrolase [Wocania arenilitoris]
MRLKHALIKSTLLFTVFLLLSCQEGKQNNAEVIAENVKKESQKEVSYSYTKLNGIGEEANLTRRDPSDVIMVNGQYYVWYTKTDKHFSGYNASIWYATSKDGVNWEEKGEAIPRGAAGSWDAYSVFTPNVLKSNNKFYLYYTGVKPTPGNAEGVFENNSVNDITAIGLMEADSPDGPFKRVSENPILETSTIKSDFDSYRIDDSCVLYREGKYWLYYKGRSANYGNSGPSHTKMGVAIANQPEGPYEKHTENPITNGGHEVMVWPHKEGVMTLLSSHGTEGRTLQYAKDGINFYVIGSFDNKYPKAPGYFRFDDFEGEKEEKENITWGISMFYGDRANNIWPYLMRYDIEIKDAE